MNTNRIAQVLAAILVFAALSITGNAQLSQTTLSGYIYDQTGVGRAGIEVFVVKTLKDGQVVGTMQNKATSTTGGAISLTVVRGSTIYLYSPDVPAWARNGRQGVPYAIPDSSTYSIENLASLASVYQQQGDTAPAGPNGRPVRVAGNTADGVKFYGQIGTAGVAGTPGWWTITGSGLSASQNNSTKTLTLSYSPTLAELLAGFGSQTANTVLAGPTTGSAATASFRALVAADLPSHTHALSNLTQSGATSGQVASWNGSAWVPATVASGWGSITGTLSSQTDLQAALDLKANLISPSFTTPTLGVATATSINKVAITAPATSATLTIADGKTGTFSNTITIAGTDGSTLNVGTGGTLGTAAYTASTAYEVPLTFSTGLTRSTNTITINTSQNISTLSNLTSNGYVTTSGGTGALSISTASGILDSIGSTRGSILYRGASGWAILTPGTSGQALLSNGAGADPSFQSVAGSVAIGGTVTSGTTGSLLFVGSGPVLSQNNSQLFWDNSNNRIGLGTTSPAVQFHVLRSDNNWMFEFENSGAAAASGFKYSLLGQLNGSVGVTDWDNATVLEGRADGGITLSAYGGPLTLQSGTSRLTRLAIDTAGDITLKGASADLFWQRTNNRLALGTTSPATAFHASLSDVDVVSFRLENTNSTSTNKYVNFFAGGTNGGGVTQWQNTGVLESAMDGGLLISATTSGGIKFETNDRNRAGSIDSSYRWALGGSHTAAAQLDVRPANSSTVGQIIQLASGQTARALNIRDSTATFLSGFDSAGRLEYSSGITSTTATAGAQTLPANPAGFLVITIGGTQYKVPYYAN